VIETETRHRVVGAPVGRHAPIRQSGTLNGPHLAGDGDVRDSSLSNVPADDCLYPCDSNRKRRRHGSVCQVTSLLDSDFATPRVDRFAGIGIALSILMATHPARKLCDFVAHDGNVRCCSIGPRSGQLLATGGDDGRVNIWRIGFPSTLRVSRRFARLRTRTSADRCVCPAGAEL